MSARTFLPQLLLFLTVAVIAHVATVCFLPSLLMAAAEARIAKGGGVNRMSFPSLPDETSRAVVRPSPDLLYSICVFDLSQHDVHLYADVPKHGYWSLALYGNNTDAFFVTDNKAAMASAAVPDLGFVVDAVLTRRRASDMTGATATMRAPTNRGIVLIRRLIESSSDLAAQDAFRRRATCETR